MIRTKTTFYLKLNLLVCNRRERKKGKYLYNKQMTRKAIKKNSQIILVKMKQKL